DRAVEVVRAGRIRPGVEVVATDAPVPRVALGRGHRCVLRDEVTVDVELDAGGALGGDDVVPLAVVEAGAAPDRLCRTGVEAEDDRSGVRHVHVAVIVAGVPGGAAAVADQLPALPGGGAEPELRGEFCAHGGLGARHDPSRARPVEARIPGGGLLDPGGPGGDPVAGD